MTPSSTRTLAGIDWGSIGELRANLAALPTGNLIDAAQSFVGTLFERFDTIILARMFAVMSLGSLPETDRAFAARMLPDKPSVESPVLSLLATRGREASWNERLLSKDHLAIPLSKAVVSGAPMLAKLLLDLEIDDARPDPVFTRKLAGGVNAMFFVQDASSARDVAGRPIINSSFASNYGVKTVFGMGGTYVDKTQVIAILFTTEHLDRLVVDRFPSFISTFKMATADVVARRQIYT